MDFVDALKAEIYAIQCEARKFVDATDRIQWLRQLVFLYNSVVCTEDLLETAVRKTAPGRLHDYFAEHLEEERGHDKWLRDCLASAGIDVDCVPIAQESVDMIGSIYYWMQRRSSVALLGYMATLEFFPLSADTVAKLEEVHGAELMYFTKHHATEDVAHGNDLAEVIASLTPDEQTLVRTTALMTATYQLSAVKRM